LDLGVRYGRRIFGNLYGSAGMNWQFGRQGMRDAKFFDAGLSSPLGRNFSAYMLFSRAQPAIGKADNRVFLAVSWFPTGTRQSGSISHDTRAQDTRLQWRYTPTRTVDAFDADLTAERGPTQDIVRGEASYTGYRFETRVYHTGSFDRANLGTSQQRTSLTMGSALAFADGHLAVSRPISDSFVMVAPHPSLGDRKVEVNALGDVPEAKTDVLGPAMLPQLTSYYRYQVQIDAQDLPLGLDLGPDFYTVQPSYRSGIVVPAGTGGTVILNAALSDFAGTALDLELGSARMADDPNRAPIDFFTNKLGRLQIGGLAPGKVIIELKNYPEIPITLTIPNDAEGIYDAGKLEVPVVALPVRRGQ